MWYVLYTNGKEEKYSGKLDISVIRRSQDILQLIYSNNNGMFSLYPHDHILLDTKSTPIPWPQELNFNKTSLYVDETSKDYISLGIVVEVANVFTTMGVRIFPDGHYKPLLSSIPPQIECASVDGARYWKIYYKDPKDTITPRVMSWEEAPETGVMGISLFFNEGHSSYPRVQFIGHDYYWKSGDTFGYAYTQSKYASGSIKLGSYVVDELWKWIKVALTLDYRG